MSQEQEKIYNKWIHWGALPVSLGISLKRGTFEKI